MIARSARVELVHDHVAFSTTEDHTVVGTWNGRNKERWERGLAALSKFRKREGHCCPPRVHIEGTFNLGPWVSVQRYRKDLIPIERKRRLDAIGFVWDWREQLWEQKFAA
jgi:hypothetical protein